MANFSWTMDAPTGTYKNQALSESLRYAAIAETKFMQFVRPEAGYGRKQGESITITRVSTLAIPSDGRISEGVNIPESALTLSTKVITVTEWGRAVPYTSLSDDLSKYDIENIIQRTLRDQMAIVMDSAAADAFQSSDVKVSATPTGAGSISFGTNGVYPATASSNLNLYHIEQIRDYMKGTLKVPGYEGSDYIGILSTKACRGIKSDPNFEQWHKYTDPQSKYNSEIGRIEGIRIIESNNFDALDNAVGTGGVLGEGVFFGSEAVAMAVVLDPELRAEIPRDFGRQKAIAWYGICEFGSIWDTASPGEAKIVKLGSL